MTKSPRKREILATAHAAAPTLPLPQAPGSALPQAPGSALQKAESRYRRGFEAAREGLLFVDFQSRAITEVNPFMARLLGVSPADLLGRELLDIGFFSDASHSQTAFEALRDAGTLRFEVAGWKTAVSPQTPLHLEVEADLFEGNEGEGSGDWVQCRVRDVSQQRREEEMLRFEADLVGTVGQAVIATDLAGHITYWNPCAAELLGYSPDHALGASFSTLLLPAEAQQEMQQQEIIARIIAGGQKWSQEFEMVRRDATRLSILATHAPLFDADQKRIGGVWVASDLGERKRLEEAQAQLVSVVRSSSDAIFSIDLSGTIASWNHGAHQLYGYEPHEAIGASLSLIFPPYRNQLMRPLLERIRRGETIKNFEMVPAHKRNEVATGAEIAAEAQRRATKDVKRRRFPARDGSQSQVSLSISPIYDGNCQITGASVIARDISEQTRAREASLRSEKLYRALAANFPNGAVYLLDLEGRFFLAEGRGLATVGFSSDLLIGKSLHDVLGQVPSYARFIESFEQALQGSEAAIEVELNGRFRALRVVPVRDEGGEIAFVLALTQDITERILAERALAQSEMRMRALVESIEEVVFEFSFDSTCLDVWAGDETRLSRPKAQIIGQRFSEVWDEKVAAPFLETLRRIEAGGPAECFEYCLDFGQGTRWFAARVSPIISAGGHINSVCFLARDISEQKRSDAALERTNREILTIWDSMSDAFFAVDTQWNFTRVNAQAGLLMHRDPSELLGQNLWDEFPDAVNLAFYSEFSRALHDQVPVMFEEFFEPLQMWTELHVYPSPLGLSVYFRDITDRKHDEQALRISEARFQNIVANVPGMVYQFVLHPDGAFSFPFISEGCRELAGVEPDQIKANPQLLVDIICPNDVQQYSRSVMKSALDLQPWSWEGRGQLASGEKKWVQGFSRPRRMPDGSTLWDGLLVDVTARKQAEEERDRFFTLALDMLAISDSDGFYRRTNPAFSAVLGYAPEEIVGQKFAQWVHPDDQSAAQAHFEQLRSGQRIADFVLRHICKDGEVKWLSWSIAPFENLFYAAAHDITPLIAAKTALAAANEELEARVVRRTEELALANEGLRIEIIEKQTVLAALRDASEAFRLAKEEADAANHAKSEFLGRMSHELRTPLNAILGFGQILQSADLGRARNEHVTQIVQGGWHLLNLINEVLDISRVETGFLETCIETVSLGELIEESCALVKPLAAQKQVRLEQEHLEQEHLEQERSEEGTLNGAHLVRADRQRLKQVLINLLSNGIKYNQRGGSVTLSCHATPHNRIRLAVRDTGQGISPANQQKLFMPFERLNAADSGIEGSGLGLLLSRRLMMAMNGTLEVESEVGQGSTFWVELPAAPATMMAAEIISTERIANEAGAERLAEAEGSSSEWHGASPGEPLDESLGESLGGPLGGEDVVDFEEALRLAPQAPLVLQSVASIPVPAPAMPTEEPLRILVAEDNLVNQRVVFHQLQILGHLPEIYDNGYDIIKAWQEGDFDLILMDCHMPKLDGYAATREIRYQEAKIAAQRAAERAALMPEGEALIFEDGPHIPIIALTANALGGDRKKSLASGMDDHLSKPINQAELSAALGRWLWNLPAQPRTSPQGSKRGSFEETSVLEKERWDELQSELDAELLQGLVEVFLDEAPQLVAAIQRALGEEDGDTVREIAHKLKGSCATMGAARMLWLCRDIENLAEQGHLKSLAPQLRQLEGELDTTHTELQAYLDDPATFLI